ncbi:MAG: LamG-like jellyroll fold domain-containing protein, partial [Phycisphaerales bacterium]
TTAIEPIPTDGATDISRDVVLGWTGTDYAASHNVYFGTSADEVANADAASPLLVSQGSAETAFDPEGLLEYGKTYYWRVDEVNAAPDNTVFKGEVWNFTVEPFAYPIKNITATASGNSRQDTGPQNTVNGSGLDASDQHSVELTQMWMSNEASPKWIQYEFDKVYAIDELWVWNANQVIEGFVGFGARNVAIEYSTDGATWTTLEGVPEFARASGLPTYTANTVVDFGGVNAKYVKLNIDSNWGGVAKQVSIAEVRFFYVPFQAFQPVPADAATNVALTASMEWRPGRDAVSHKVFFDADSAAVAAAGTVTEPSFTPSAMNLDTTYFWRVDEIGDAGTYEGDVWSFTTEKYLVIDDFDAYTDDEGSRIYESWIDGITSGASGSQVGYDSAPFAEATIVHGGRQSMPLKYDNSQFAFSEAELAFDSAQNWSARGVKSLAIYFAGAAGNTGQLYLKINNTKVAYNGAAADLTRGMWQAWNVDLSTAGNVSSVRSLKIGIEGAGAKGILYIDDIRLYPKAPEFVTPVDPGKANLVGLWTLDGNASDTSGKGNNGTVTGGVANWVPGMVGQAMDFQNGQTFIDCGKGASLNLTDAITITGWIRMGFTAADRKIVANQDGTTGGYKMGLYTNNKLELEIRTSANAATLNRDTAGGAVLQQDVWYHVAGVYSKGKFIRTYVYGNLDRELATTAVLGASTASFKLGCGESATSYFWLGALDDMRVYNRALSQEEIMFVMGQTQPVAKPF